MRTEAVDIEVRLSGIHRRFREGSREHVVLDGVDLEVRRGETVALRGRSGSGKSTLLNLVGGIDVADAGSVLIGDIELSSLTEHDRTLFRRKHIGFVYQAFNLIPTLNVADNIRLVLELNKTGARSERIAELLQAVGLEDRAGSYPDVLSGGEQQRVALARALAHKPRLILADEPTGNLDDAAAENVLGLLNALVRQNQCTLIMATHSAHVAKSCDRVVEMHAGKLEEVS